MVNPSPFPTVVRFALSSQAISAAIRSNMFKRLLPQLSKAKPKYSKADTGFRDIGQKGDPSQESMWKNASQELDCIETKIRQWAHSASWRGFSGERGCPNGRIQSQWCGLDCSHILWTRSRHACVAVLSIRAGASPRYHSDGLHQATDTEGDTQPKTGIENERGYGNNSWLDHGHALSGLQKDEAPETTAAA